MMELASNNEKTTQIETDSSEEVSGDNLNSTVTQHDMLYTIYDASPWPLSFLLGLQHFVTAFGTILSVSFILWPLMCGTDPVAFAEFVSTGIFASGIVTILQAVIGVRLPIVQGSGVAFVAPIIAILSLPKWQCPSAVNEADYCGAESNNTSSYIDTDEFTPRILEIQGAIILAAIFQVFVGIFGLVGLILRYIGPLVTATVISLMAISLFAVTARLCEGNWPIAITTVFIVLLFSQYLRNIGVPCCQYDKRCTCSRFPIFKLFAVILAILFTWFVCWILTISNAFPDDEMHWTFGGRTDTKSCVLSKAKWFRVPYPGQWGVPTFSAASALGMLAGIVAGLIDKIGNYYIAAKLSRAPDVPVHAVNRGIFIDAIGSIVMGVCGSGSGTAAYSENLGLISITEVGSTRVVIVCGFIMIALGTIGKFGALFVTIPSPVIGGALFVLFGINAAIGVSNLHVVDMKSARNVTIFGFSFFFGLSFPQWLNHNPTATETGNYVFDQVVITLLSTSILVGGVLAFVLDNTIPGTRRERGFQDNFTTEDQLEKAKELTCYDIPFGMNLIKKWKWTEYLPISPTFTGFKKMGCKKVKVNPV